jgi:hypothetical protein
MESQQMMELLLALREDMKANQEEIDGNQTKADANMKTMREKADTDRKAD